MRWVYVCLWHTLGRLWSLWAVRVYYCVCAHMGVHGWMCRWIVCGVLLCMHAGRLMLSLACSAMLSKNGM